MDYYKEDIQAIYSSLKSSENGISVEDAESKLEQYGRNVLKAGKPISKIKLFLQQFSSPVVWVLIAAATISALVHEVVDFYVIVGVLALNAIIGFFQEYKAEKAIEALKKMAALKTRVIRDNTDMEIDAEELVPGDIIILEEGDKVPADARLISLTHLEVQEAALTGESIPVKKELTSYSKTLELGDRKNMVFSGTVITGGKARAIVTGTGMKSEIGKIATLLSETEKDETPLQRRLDVLGKQLAKGTLILCIIVFLILVFVKSPIQALLTSVSLAVAAIPEGLPAVVTIALAFGVRRMVKKNALIRKLPSVETLGSTTVICSDKTGTLTKNEMTVRKIYVDGQVIEVSGAGYEPEGDFTEHPKDLDLLLKIGLLNNDAKLEKSEQGYKIIGDPTEGALLVSGEKGGFNHLRLTEESPRVDEVEFNSERKRMTTIHTEGKKKFAYMKGAPDIVIKQCTKMLRNGKVVKLDKKAKDRILETNQKFAGDALRVLGFAYKEVKKGQKYEDDLIFVGLQAMIDPPREEVKLAIQKCKTAGIKVVMITGDFQGTAVAIAKELGIEGRSITGLEIDKMDLDKEVENIGIYARVNPEHKMKIVDALQRKGHIVAMTGDGVNDAPAIKSSNIGIAMNITGTDVAKESSDMLLLDDNFASIVNAVEEGRTIYDNIKKFMQYLLSSNVGEVLVIFLATIIGTVFGLFMYEGDLILPLIPAQILWMNLVTDLFPALALGLDPAEDKIMQRPPKDSKEDILTKKFGLKVSLMGIIIAVATLVIFWYYFSTENTPKHAQTVAFTTLVVLQFVRLYAIRSEFSMGLFSNKYLIAAVAVSLSLQLLVIYTPLSHGFDTVPLVLMDWALIGGLCVITLIASTLLTRVLKLQRS